MDDRRAVDVILEVVFVRRRLMPHSCIRERMHVIVKLGHDVLEPYRSTRYVHQYVWTGFSLSA